MIKKDEKFKINKNFLELLSKTRIASNNTDKKAVISDEEYKKEYKKVENMLLSNNPTSQEQKNFGAKTLVEISKFGVPGSLSVSRKKPQKSQSGSIHILDSVKKLPFNQDIYIPILTNRKIRRSNSGNRGFYKSLNYTTPGTAPGAILPYNRIET